MGEIRKMIDPVTGRVHMVAVEHDPGHVNPPLTKLNQSYLEAQTEHHDDVRNAVKAAGGAVREVLMGRPGRRGQKNVRPAPARA